MKMKVFITLLIILVLFIGCNKDNDNKDNDKKFGDFYYREYSGENAIEGYIITGYEGESQKITIPNEIKGKPVIAISENAFYWENITSVTIPDNIEMSIFSFTPSLFYLYENNDKKKKTFSMAYSIADEYEIIIIDNAVVEIINYLGEGTESDVPENVSFEGSLYDYERYTISVSIPEKINGLPVIALRNKAFSNGDKNSIFSDSQSTKKPYLDKVVIPDSVIFIGESVFQNNGLSSVILPNQLKYIGREAFAENRLTNIIIPDTVEYIGWNAFRDNSITNVVIPDTIKILEGGAFAENRLTSIIIPDSMERLKIETFDRNLLTSIIIPNSIKTIDSTTFSNNKLKNVVIGNSVETIDFRAFYNNQITSIIIPNSVKKISTDAFLFNQLTSITLPDNVDIDPSSFYASIYEHYTSNGKKKTTYSIILTTEGDFEIAIINNTWVEILRHISGNQEVIIPETIKELPVVAIGNYAFSNGNYFMGTNWSNIPYLDSERNIEMTQNRRRDTDILLEIFSKERTLTESDTNYPNVNTSILGVTGDRTGEKGEKMKNMVNRMVDYTSQKYAGIYPDNNLTSIVIPNTVKIIGCGAFAYNRLTEVIIPKSVKYIGYEAFDRIPKLTHVDMYASTKIQDYAFSSSVKVKKRYW